MSSEVRRRRYGDLITLVALVVTSVTIFFAVRAARITAWRTSRGTSLKSVGLALHNFHDTYKRLPTAVHRDETEKPLSSWRFRILPFVESIMTHLEHSERWDDPVNEWRTKEPHWTFCFGTNRHKPECLYTNVVAITGPGTAFDGDAECSLHDIDADTILAIEVADSGIHWAAPGDLSITEASPSILKGLDGDGVHVLFADGSVWYVLSSVDFKDLQRFFTVEGAWRFDRKQVLGPHSVNSRTD